MGEFTWSLKGVKVKFVDCPYCEHNSSQSANQLHEHIKSILWKIPVRLSRTHTPIVFLVVPQQDETFNVVPCWLWLCELKHFTTHVSADYSLWLEQLGNQLHSACQSLHYYCLLSALNTGVGQSSWVVLNELQPLQCIRILTASSLAVGLDLLNFVPVHVRPDWCSHIITMVVCIPTCTKTAKNQHFEYTPGWPGRNTATQVNLFLSNCSLVIIYIKWLLLLIQRWQQMGSQMAWRQMTKKKFVPFRNRPVWMDPKESFD